MICYRNALFRSTVIMAMTCSMLVTSGLSARVDPKVLEAFEQMERVPIEKKDDLSKVAINHKSDLVKVFVTLHANKAEAETTSTTKTIGVRGGAPSKKRTSIAYPTLAATQESIIVDLEHTHARISHTFSITPAMAMGVTREGLAALAKNPQVKSIEVDPEVKLFENDRRIPRQQKARKLLDAAASVIGSEVRRENGNDGQDVVVAIVDTGIDTDHDDLELSLIDEACFYEDDYGWGGCPGNCGYYGCTNATGPGASEDQNGHGTHVASIVSSDGIVAGGAHQGIAPKASIVGVKVFGSSGFTSTSNIIAGLEWLKTAFIDQGRRMDLINMSLGSLQSYPAGSDNCNDLNDSTEAYYEAIQALRDGGVLTIVAAGNDDADFTGVPACLSNTLAVGASDDNDDPAWFTNSDHLTDVFAPGVDIIAGYVGGGLEELSGTSMAAPVTAGCAALLIQNGDATTPEQIEQRLESTDTRVSRNGRSYPRINCLPDPVARCSATPVTISDCSATNDEIFALVDAGSTGGPFSDIYFSGIDAPGLNQATMYLEAHGVVDQCSVDIIVTATDECVRPTTTTTTSTTTTSYVPDNDTCETATDLGPLGYGGTASSMGATTDATQENNLPCGIWNGFGVWYKFTATADTTIEASLCGSSYDTRVAIFTSAYDTICGSLTCLNSNDDSSCGLQSRTTSTVTAGETYYIVVSGYSLSKGEYVLDVSGGEAPTTTTTSTTTSTTTTAPFNGCSEGESPNAFLTIMTDNYAGETTWNITQGEAELFSGGPYALDFTEYSHEFCLTPGAYDFNIYDSFGDGICCYQGNGNYTLVVDDQVFEGGVFERNDTVSFVVYDGSSTTTQEQGSTNPTTTSTSTSTTTTTEIADLETSTEQESTATSTNPTTTSTSSSTTPQQGGTDDCPSGESQLTVTIIYDSDSLPLQWELLDNASGSQLTHGGSSTSQQASQFEEFVESVCLGSGTYQFKIHGNSFFEVSLDDSVLHSGGGIESEEEVIFVVN